MNPDSHRAALDRAIGYFESLTEATVADLPRFYTEDAYFKDPFNEVRGVAQITAIFAAMYGPLADPRFQVTESIQEGERALLVWNFTFRIRKYQPKVTQTIRGVSHLHLAPDGRIAFHRDYWDAAEELYAKLPLLGALMRWLQNRLRVAAR